MRQNAFLRFRKLIRPDTSLTVFQTADVMRIGAQTGRKLLLRHPLCFTQFPQLIPYHLVDLFPDDAPHNVSPIQFCPTGE